MAIGGNPKLINGDWMWDGPIRGLASQNTFRFVAPHGGRIVGMRAWCPSGWISGLQILATDSKGKRQDSPLFGDCTGTQASEFVLAKSEILTGITGKYGYYIDNIVPETSEDDPPATVRRLGHDGGPLAFSILPAQLLPGATIQGFYGCVNNNNIAAVGVVCEVPGPPNPDLQDPNMRWLDSTARPFPHRDDSVVPVGLGAGTAIPPHGNFETPVLYRVELDGGTLKIWGETGLFRTLTFRHATEDAITSDTPYLYQDEHGHDVLVKMPGAEPGYIKLADDLTLATARQYDLVKSSELTFSHIFANEAETPFDQAPFVGWDLTQIDPRSLQGTDPLCHNIFAYPADSSHAYHKSEWGKQKTVPNGVMFVSSIHSDSLTRTDFASTEKDIQSSWTTSFGAKLGMGETTLFKSNNTFRNSIETKLTKAASSTVSLFTIESHVLFADLPRVTFEDAFVRDVSALLQATNNTAYSQFIKKYGTHYAYAITYGARAYSEMFFSKEATMDAISRGKSMDLEVGGAFEGITGSANVQVSEDTSTTLSKEINAQTQHIVTEGGDASTGGHLSVGHSPVPILMDLRPLTSLLNPVFFTDPRIFTEVRPKLEKAMVDYGASLGNDFSTVSKLPPVLRVSLTAARIASGSAGFSINVHVDVDLSQPWAGKITGLDQEPQSHFYPPLQSFSSELWNGEIDSADGQIFLGINKYIHLDGSFPPFDVVLQVKYKGQPFQRSEYLHVADFRTEAKGGVLEFQGFGLRVAYQYQLIGRSVSLVQAASA